METRQYCPLDHLVINIDQALRTLAGKPLVTERPNPAQACEKEPELTESEKDESIRLMRINHCGEVSAQALYQGQALTARLGGVRKRMERAAEEENDHLEWCEQRVRELGGRLSLLNPLWYLGSFAIGAGAGLLGDKWSLGFVVETEKQVVDHLDDHLGRISENDVKSHVILQQMKVDETHHGDSAKMAGGADLPQPVRKMMKLASKFMTSTAYWV